MPNGKLRVTIGSAVITALIATTIPFMPIKAEAVTTKTAKALSNTKYVKTLRNSLEKRGVTKEKLKKGFDFAGLPYHVIKG
jgi:hypothetical protein